MDFCKIIARERGASFPDTYFFLPMWWNPERLFARCQKISDRKVPAVSDSIAQSGKTAGEIIIMASIIEREAITFKDKEIISGILWKRIEMECAFKWTHLSCTLSTRVPLNLHELT